MFTKNNKTNETPQPAEPMKNAAPAQDAIRGASSKPAARAASIICADMKINGSVTSEGALQIDGIVDGDVAATDITIGASGHITGEVKAEVVKVKGKIIRAKLLFVQQASVQVYILKNPFNAPMLRSFLMTICPQKLIAWRL